jgi:pimeloyl-ACP methyl ester carboxylesterase
VLLEAGEMPVETGLAPFAADALKNGTIQRYCYWDRPGFAWSDNAPSPLSAGMAADALSEALARAGEDGPWILVSAGVGSIYSRIFASRHANDIKGIMLIDGLHESLLHRVGAPGRGFMIWLRGVISPLGIDRLFGAIFKRRSRGDRVYGWSSYQSDKFLRAKLQENLVANGMTKNEINSARTIQSRQTRLVVISSGIEIRRDRNWERNQRDLSTLTDNLIGWDIVNWAPHEVWETPRGRKTMEKRLGQMMEEFE